MTIGLFILAALAEIAGCFAFWAWARNGASALWLLPGLICLGLFGWLLSSIDADAAGRVFAAYGGIHIAVSLGWMWCVAARMPDRWDLIGALIILNGPRGG